MDNRFGMFIHWGIYAGLGYHEQAFARLGLPRAEYEALADSFNPVDYDPEGWVSLARHAGMRYICVTAKHHDGFCMWDTKYTDYNIMHTPYGRDVLKELAEACAHQNMALSIYYSNPDWHDKNGYNAASTHQWRAAAPADADNAAYRQFIKDQITELLTGYGKIYTLFWDIPPHVEDGSINALARELQPGILINDRGHSAGDFATPERSVPDGSRFERMTEACQSVGEQSWGYRENEDYYTPRFLMSSVCKIMAMGGSYLLNVGPDGAGRIPAPAAQLVSRVGDWYGRVREALEGTDGEVFPYELNGGNPYVATRRKNCSYLNFYDGLVSSAVILFGCDRHPVSVTLLNTGESLSFAVTSLPDRAESDGRAYGPCLHISGIPAASLSEEPVVLRIEW